MASSQYVDEFDDDGYDDEYEGEGYGEEGEMSAEDQAAMTKGTADVRKALGKDSNKVTLAVIQDALWHYFYDVEKSVAYLRKEFVNPRTTQPASKPPPPKKVPEGGLLGGGEAGMSKLQKLAAARKKKQDEKGAADNTAQAEKDLGKLSLSAARQEDEVPVNPLAKRQKLSKAADVQVGVPEQAELENEEADSEPPQTIPSVAQEESVVELPEPTSAPSAFARTLLGPTQSAPRDPPRDLFPIPYTLSSQYSADTFSTPSPDDIVFAAQSQAGKKATAQAKASAKKNEGAQKSSGTEQAASDLSTLKISDAPPPKTKGLNVVKEFENSASKRSVSFVVVELKFVEQRTIDKYRRQGEKIGKQSFALAWVMDQRSDERERGVTIDIATNHFETDVTKFTILDAPGHQDFVPNMIAGASQADFAVLVIDANTGAYEKGLKGQTREHVLLLRSLGVQRLVVAINKLDMVDWSQERFNEILYEVTGFLTGLGFQEKHVSFIPISGLNGDNTVKPIENPAAAWYKGTTLIEALEASGPSAARALQKPLRMAISEIFRSQQGSQAIGGRIDTGTMQVGDVLVIQPSGETAHIKSISVDGETRDWAVAGYNVNLSLTDIDPVHMKVGDILCHPQDAIATGDSFMMKAMAFDHLLPSPIDLHRGRLHAAGQIQSIIATLDKATGEVIKKKPKIVQPGGVARVKIKLETKVPLEAGQRVVIRSGGETIAAGLIES
ncbi:elongation factor 1 alpha-like protein [Emericellopsis cladophorae]|uniref:Elongation factor 1 alpha-like protein n=1 Tax=Emericellopsis cladophorae TaxID=2686198 RepID=A0A9Q0BHF1_9HYPO|nr:elongation factor 1 alpha-like protein [Emericellopsis cladophorae]KAI6784339.1 elongation factor 1 alpha-like protein [Emericellopsis cladophorae]